MAAYSEIIVEHVENPRNLGIAHAKFRARGCAAAQALGSVLSEFLHGADAARLDAVEETTIAAMLGGLAPEHHVSTLGLRLVYAVRAELTRAS